MTDGQGRRIVAVVVTYNRLPLLQRLVARLAEVPELDEVLVVDNASTDGTGEWLDGRAGLEPDRSPTNTGGAGGFHDGLAWAVERGADLVWLMDDDGLPDPDCLATLLEHADLDFWGPVVVDEDDPDRLVFPIRLPGGTRTVRAMAEVRAAATDGLIRDVVIPFNGVLVTRDLVERIGLPRAEFFIWGDDVEYLWRANEAGARIATVVGRGGAPPERRRPRHPDDVRPDDVQPQPERPQALLHGAQQHGQPAHLPRLAARADVLGQDGVVLPVHQAPAGPAPDERAGDVRRAARRLHRAPEVPRMTEPRPSPSSW